jgi:hypothetical protein
LLLALALTLLQTVEWSPVDVPTINQTSGAMVPNVYYGRAIYQTMWQSVQPLNPKGQSGMLFKLDVNPDKLKPLLGTAYPRFDSVSPAVMAELFKFILQVRTDCQDKFTVEHETSTFSDIKPYSFSFSVRFDSNTHGYYTACKVEEYIDTLKTKRKLPPKLSKMVQLFLIKRKNFITSYMLERKYYEQVAKWLYDNCELRDYQIYSKFGGDVSIAFRKKEHSAMYKLKFFDNSPD